MFRSVGRALAGMFAASVKPTSPGFTARGYAMGLLQAFMAPRSQYYATPPHGWRRSQPKADAEKFLFAADMKRWRKNARRLETWTGARA